MPSTPASNPSSAMAAGPKAGAALGSPALSTGGTLRGTEPGGTHCVADLSVDATVDLSIYVAPPGGGEAPELKISGSMSARALLNLSYAWQREELTAGFHTCPSPPGPPGTAWPVCPFFLVSSHWQPPAPPGALGPWGATAASQIQDLVANFSGSTPPPGVGTYDPRPHIFPIPQGSTDGQPGFWSKPGSTARAKLPGDIYYTGTTFDAFFEWGSTLQGAITTPSRPPKPGYWSRPLNLLGKSPTSPPGLQGLLDLILDQADPTRYVGPLPHSDPPGWPCYYTGDHEGRVTVAASYFQGVQVSPEVREHKVMNPANWPKVGWTDCVWTRCAASTFTPGATQVQHTALRPSVRYPVGVSASASVSLTGPASRKFTLDLDAYALDLFKRFPVESYWGSGPRPLLPLQQAIRDQAGPMLVERFTGLWAFGPGAQQHRASQEAIEARRLDEWRGRLEDLNESLAQGFQELLDALHDLPDLAQTLRGRFAQHLDPVVAGVAAPGAPHVLQAKSALQALLVMRLPLDGLYAALKAVMMRVLQGQAPFTFATTSKATEGASPRDFIMRALTLWQKLVQLPSSSLPLGDHAPFELLARSLADAIVSAFAQGPSPLLSWLVARLEECFDILGTRLQAAGAVQQILAVLTPLAKDHPERAMDLMERLVSKTHHLWDGQTAGGFERTLAARVAHTLAGGQ